MDYEDMRHSPWGKYLLEAYELSCKKNMDYGSKDNPFANFDGTKEDLGVLDSTGVAVRLRDKWIRFCHGVKRDGKFAVSDDSMHDTCIDIINYVAIYMAVKEREQDK